MGQDEHVFQEEEGVGTDTRSTERKNDHFVPRCFFMKTLNRNEHLETIKPDLQNAIWVVNIYILAYLIE